MLRIILVLSVLFLGCEKKKSLQPKTQPIEITALKLVVIQTNFYQSIIECTYTGVDGLTRTEQGNEFLNIDFNKKVTLTAKTGYYAYWTNGTTTFQIEKATYNLYKNNSPIESVETYNYQFLN